MTTSESKGRFFTEQIDSNRTPRPAYLPNILQEVLQLLLIFTIQPCYRYYTGWAKKTGPQTHDHNSVKY